MYRTIVVGCDGTQSSHEAVALAQQLRDPKEGRIILVSAFSIYHGFAGAVTPFVYADWLERRAQSDLDLAESRLERGVIFEKQTMASGSAAEALDDVAVTVNADLIVTGPSHHGTLGKLTGRSTVQRMLHGAPCALAVAAPGQERRFAETRRIAVAYDGTPEAELAVDTACELAAALGATLCLCTAIEPIVYASGFAGVVPDIGFVEDRERAAYEHLDAAAVRARDDVEVELRVGHGPAAATLLSLAEDADLIVAGSRGYGPVHRVLAGSVSTGLLTDGELPILVTPRVVAEKAIQQRLPVADTRV